LKLKNYDRLLISSAFWVRIRVETVLKSSARTRPDPLSPARFITLTDRTQRKPQLSTAPIWQLLQATNSKFACWTWQQGT